VVIAVAEPTFELIYDDGEPVESNWHRIQFNLLIDVVRQAMVERGRADFFVGGNMFIYYSVEQARAIATRPIEETRQFRGPDVFFVAGVNAQPDRKAWVVWEEGGRYPDVLIELLSPSTANIDRTIKKEIYERTFRTPEYFLYDREAGELTGFRLVDGRYEALVADAHGRLRSRELDLWLGRWEGERQGLDTTWIRCYDAQGRLVPTAEEAARQNAEAERQRADAAEVEVARLTARLAELGEN
jgi:Uma2 family endonuclease